MCQRARGERTALQVVANGQPVQGSRSFATPKKVVHTDGTQDPIRVFCNPYSIGLSAISRSLDESPSLSAGNYL
jgi:poly(3-hydroxybutyrate) depolymerase